MSLRLRLISALLLPLFLLNGFYSCAEETGQLQSAKEKGWVLKDISSNFFLLHEKQSEKTFQGKPFQKNSADSEYLNAMLHGLKSVQTISGSEHKNRIFPVIKLACRTLMYPHHGFW